MFLALVSERITRVGAAQKMYCVELGRTGAYIAPFLKTITGSVLAMIWKS